MIYTHESEKNINEVKIYIQSQKIDEGLSRIKVYNICMPFFIVQGRMIMIKDIIDKLYSIYQDDKDTLIEIQDSLSICADYLNSIYKEEIQNALKECRQAHEEKDRTYAAALSSIRYLNELCMRNHLPLLFKGDLADKSEVVSFIKELILDSFDNRYK